MFSAHDVARELRNRLPDAGDLKVHKLAYYCQGPRPRQQDPADDDLAVIDYVVDQYGRHTGRELVRKTHLEDPWQAVSESEDSFATANPEISHEAMRAWFSQDDEFVAHRSALARLRARQDVYGLGGPTMPGDLRAATLRVLGDSSG